MSSDSFDTVVKDFKQELDKLEEHPEIHSSNDELSDEVFANEEIDNVFGENVEEQEKIPCIFKDDGCTYEDYRMNQLKHRQWTCKYSKSSCHQCGQVLEVSQMQHCLLEHLSFPRQQDLLNVTNCEYGKSYQGVVSVYGVNFYCSWSTYKKNCFDASVICDASKHETGRFKFELQLFVDQITPIIVGHMNVLKNSLFDWNFTGYAEETIYSYRIRFCVFRRKDSEMIEM